MTVKDPGITHKVISNFDGSSVTLGLVSPGEITKNFYNLLREKRKNVSGERSAALCYGGDKFLKHFMTLARFGCYLTKAEISELLTDLDVQVAKRVVGIQEKPMFDNSKFLEREKIIS
jgi:hypothetical protein